MSKYSAHKILEKDELSIFASQLSMLVKGGISLYDAMSLLADNAQSHEQTKALYEKIKSELSQGYSFGEVLEQTEAFPFYFVQMIKIGESSGRLEEVLASLGVYYEKSEYISQSIKSATRYPIIIIFVLLIVLSVIITKVLPVFSGVYEQLGVSMTGISRVLLSFGDFLNKYGLIILAVLAALIAAAVVFFRTPKGEAFGQRLYENSVFTRNIAKQSAVGKFAYAFSMCISSGMNIDEALDMANTLVESNKISASINSLKQLMSGGESFVSALSKTDIFSPVYVGMIQVGIKTGMLDVSMKNVADRYSIQTDERISHAISVIEPTLVIIISVVIGLLLLAVMLPLINVMSTL